MAQPNLPDAANPRLQRPENNENEEYEDAPRGIADWPWVTVAMQIAIALVFFALWRAGNGDIALVSQAFGAKDKQLIDAGQKWRFVTAIFLHGSLVHLAVNSVSLWTLGAQIERIYGAKRYFLVYMIAGIAGNLASYVSTPGPSLGASGAIFGLVGAGLIFPIRFRSLVPDEARSKILNQLFWVAVVNLAIGFSMKNVVDNYAHMGGLVGGGFAALFLLPDALDDRPRNRLREAGLWAMVALMFGVICWAARSQWLSYRPRFVPTLALYVLPERDPWWGVAIPDGWTRRGRQWHHGGATVEFTDSVLAPGIAQTVMQAAQKSQAYLNEDTINGRNVRRIILPTADRITEYWLILEGGRFIVFRLDCPHREYSTVQPALYGIYATLTLLKNNAPQTSPFAPPTAQKGGAGG